MHCERRGGEKGFLHVRSFARAADAHCWIRQPGGPLSRRRGIVFGATCTGALLEHAEEPLARGILWPHRRPCARGCAITAAGQRHTRGGRSVDDERPTGRGARRGATSGTLETHVARTRPRCGPRRRQRGPIEGVVGQDACGDRRCLQKDYPSAGNAVVVDPQATDQCQQQYRPRQGPQLGPQAAPFYHRGAIRRWSPAP
mmetsp:Transcript_118516/g.335238  ORF Transcript_118516/g.335238 Transcript_118516/m.335238 type:complete len:200 (-) Transcript_118516:2156-2755(-)